MLNLWTVLAIGLLLLVLLGLFAWYRYRRARRKGWDPAAHPGLARVNRRTLGLRYAGVAVGLAVLPISAAVGQFGVGTVIAPTVVACVIEVSVIAGEVVCFRAARQPGHAGLERRTPRRYLNGWLVGLLCLVGAGVAGVMVWCGRLAADNGRSFSLHLDRGDQPFASLSFSPFLGPYYTRALAVALTAAVVLAAAAVTVVARRARNGADPALALWDDALRRRSARTAVVTLIGALGASLAAGANGLVTVHDNAAGFRAQCAAWEEPCRLSPDVGLLATDAGGLLTGTLLAVGLVLALAAAAFVMADVAPVPDRGVASLGGANPGGPNVGGFNSDRPNLGEPNPGGFNPGGPDLSGRDRNGSNRGRLNLGGPGLGGPGLGGLDLGGTGRAGPVRP